MICSGVLSPSLITAVLTSLPAIKLTAVQVFVVMGATSSSAAGGGVKTSPGKGDDSSAPTIRYRSFCREAGAIIQQMAALQHQQLQQLQLQQKQAQAQAAAGGSGGSGAATPTPATASPATAVIDRAGTKTQRLS